MTQEKTVQERIVSQVGFYLGDANMPRDKFLREQASKDADGWISVSVIASFQRMKAITEDVDIVKAALKEASSPVFEADESGDNVRRKIPLPESGDLMSKSVYVKGFPKTTTLDELLDFFGSNAKDVEAVRMRRFPSSKEFKGSLFVEFASDSAAKLFLEESSTSGKIFNGSHLTTMSKLAYFEEKNRKTDSVASEFEKLATDYNKGCLVKLTGLPSGMPYMAIKTAISEVCPCEISFVEQQQDGATYVRLKEPKAQELVDAIASKEDFKIDDMAVAALIPPEDEESQYYRNLAAIMMSKKSSGKYDAKNRKRVHNKRTSDGNSRKRNCDGSEDPTCKAAKGDGDETPAADTA